MKKAVISSGGKQYLVAEGERLSVELVKQEGKTVTFEPLLLIDGDKTTVGSPYIEKATVTAEVLEQSVAAPKVTSVRFKAKKRVHTVRGHRQLHTVLKITKIS